MSDFEQWAEDYALRYEPDYTAKHEIDCKAAFEAGMEAARQAPASGEVEPVVWIDPEDAKRTMIACPGERADVSPCMEGRFSMPLYTNPPAKVPEGITGEMLNKVWKAGFDAENIDDREYCQELIILRNAVEDATTAPATPPQEQ